MTEKDFIKSFDVDYPAGRFDMSFNLIDGNPLIYRFFGSNVYFSLYRMVSEEEQKKLSDAAKVCLSNPGVQVDECIHITNGDLTECYVISLRKSKNDNSFDAELINISRNKDILNDLNRHITIARDYLTLNGEALFSYSAKDNRFHMFIVNGGQNVDLYDMDFDEWVCHICDKGLIAEEDTDTFETFCSVLKNTTVSQSYTFHGCILTDQNVSERYRVSFTPLNRMNDGISVIGSWAIVNELTQDVDNNAFEAAYIDSLTGLLNKKAIMRYAENAVDNVPLKGNHVALAIMDVDNFKGVNDNYGHLFGDKVIKAVADVIKNAIGSDAVAGRMGGDEFLIVFEKFSDELEYRNVLRCIKTNVAYVYKNKFKEDHLTCSIGLGRYGYGSCSTSFHDLFKITDKALYLAKQKGKNRYIIYKPELHGDFNSPDDKGDIVNISTNYYSASDLDKLHILISDTVIYGSEVINELLDHLRHTLMVDRINIFVGGNNMPAYYDSQSPTGGYSNPIVLNDIQYISVFDKDKMIISNIHGIEYTLPGTYRVFEQAHINSLMQHLIRDRNGNVCGLITAEVFDRFTAFPKIASQIFDITSRTINSVLIREGRI